MSTEEIIDHLKEFIISAVPDAAKRDWIKAELRVWIHPSLIQVHGSCLTQSEEMQLDLKKSRGERKRILSLLKRFHKLTANKGQTDWNTGLLTLFPNTQLEYNLHFDQVGHDEINAKQSEAAKAEGIDYVEPVWDWD
jgi:hypothetical protein